MRHRIAELLVHPHMSTARRGQGAGIVTWARFALVGQGAIPFGVRGSVARPRGGWVGRTTATRLAGHVLGCSNQKGVVAPLLILLGAASAPYRPGCDVRSYPCSVSPRPQVQHQQAHGARYTFMVYGDALVGGAVAM